MANLTSGRGRVDGTFVMGVRDHRPARSGSGHAGSWPGRLHVGSGSMERSAVSPWSFAHAAKKATRRCETIRASLHGHPSTRHARLVKRSVAARTFNLPLIHRCCSVRLVRPRDPRRRWWDARARCITDAWDLRVFHHAGRATARRQPPPSRRHYHRAVSLRARRPAVRIEPLHVADFVHPDGSPLAGRPGIVMAYAVVHPDGVLLFDTGIGVGVAEIEAAYRPAVRDLPEMLRSRGILPDDVTRWPIPTCTSIIAARTGRSPGGPSMSRPSSTRPRRVRTTRSPIGSTRHERATSSVDGDVELLPGVRLVPTPGHTPGHQSMLIECGRRAHGDRRAGGLHAGRVERR